MKRKKILLLVILVILLTFILIICKYHKNNKDSNLIFNDILHELSQTREIIIVKEKETKNFIYDDAIRKITNILANVSIGEKDKVNEEAIYKITLKDINKKIITRIEIGENIYFDKIEKDIFLNEEDKQRLVNIIEELFNQELQLN